jgi:hypothetical protein
VTLSDRVGVPVEVLARELGDETVILNLKNGEYFGLEAAGSRIWQLLTAGMTLAEVCERVEGEYDVERETLERDILALAEQLRNQGLLTVKSGDRPCQAMEPDA